MEKNLSQNLIDEKLKLEFIFVDLLNQYGDTIRSSGIWNSYQEQYGALRQSFHNFGVQTDIPPYKFKF